MEVMQLAAHINMVREGKRGTSSTFHGRPIAKAEVTKINGGIDNGLWITLADGGQCIAYPGEIVE